LGCNVAWRNAAKHQRHGTPRRERTINWRSFEIPAVDDGRKVARDVESTEDRNSRSVCASEAKRIVPEAKSDNLRPQAHSNEYPRTVKTARGATDWELFHLEHGSTLECPATEPKRRLGTVPGAPHLTSVPILPRVRTLPALPSCWQPPRLLSPAGH